MTSHLPPVPEGNRSQKGTGETKFQEMKKAERPISEVENPDKLGHQGNTHVNTTHQGYQQDR